MQKSLRDPGKWSDHSRLLPRQVLCCLLIAAVSILFPISGVSPAMAETPTFTPPIFEPNTVYLSAVAGGTPPADWPSFSLEALQEHKLTFWPTALRREGSRGPEIGSGRLSLLTEGDRNENLLHCLALSGGGWFP